MSIYLIRHGETDANAARVFQRPDNPLNATGLAQAEQIARRLAQEPIVLVVSSDYERAAQTAQRIAGVRGAPLQFDSDWRERNFGDLRGRAYSDVGAEIFAPDYEPPNGETWAQFSERVASAWSRAHALATQLSGSLAIVTHGLVCRALVQNQLTLEPPLLPPARGFRNCSLTLIEPEPPFRVRLLDCCSHLPELESARPGISGI
jgi:probable phosphoglycerate mutase